MQSQVYQKDIIILNVRIPNNMASEHTRQKLAKTKRKNRQNHYHSESFQHISQ